MNNYQYKAFISYRHVSPDKEIATKLHTLIETYGIPLSIQKKLGIKKMGRVFRDEEELPLSTNLGHDIEEALKNSEWLIVVCSPDYLESKWCNAELDYFISLGRSDHILTLLVRGEPSTSFPEQLRYEVVDGVKKEIEPLAADVRAGIVNESIKKLRNEKLRILAPMLGLSFDDLRQRAHRRQMRITYTAGFAVILLLVCLQLYTLHKNNQISQQRDIAMNNEMMLLIEEANRASSLGNKLSAVQTLNNAAEIRETIGNKNDKELSSALEYALYNEEFEIVQRIENNNRYLSKLVFSYGNKFLLGITNLNSACLIDTSNGSILHTVSRNNAGMLDSVGFSLDDKYFYLVDSWFGYVSVYKVEDGTLFREYSVDDPSTWNFAEKVFTVDDKTLLIVKPSVMVLWNYIDDTSEEVLPCGNGLFESYTLPLIVDLSPDKKDVVIGSHGYETGMMIKSLDGSKQINLEYDHERGYPIIKYSGNGEYVAGVSGNRYYVWSALNGSLLLEKENSSEYLDQDVLISYDGSIVLTMTSKFLKAVNVKTGEELWIKEGDSNLVTEAYFSPDGRYVSANGGINGVFDLYTGEMLCAEGASLFSNDSSMVITSSVNGKADLLITPEYSNSKRESDYKGILYSTPRYTDPKESVNITLIHNADDINGNIYTSEDTRYAAYTHADGYIEIFDISDPNNSINKYSHAEHCYRAVTDIIFNNDLMASCGGYDPRCVLFDLEKGQITYVLAGEGYCHRAEFSKDGSKIIILCGKEQNVAFVYSTNTGNLLYTFRCGEDEKITDIGFDEENGKVVAKLSNGEALTGIIYKDIDEMLEEARTR